MTPLTFRSLPALALLASCGAAPSEAGSDGDVSEEPPAWCEGETSQIYAPATSLELELFPDGLLQAVDEDSPTGFRLDPSRVAWTGGVEPFLYDGIQSASDLSGFGTMGGAIVRFDGPVSGVPTTAAQSVESEGWILLDLDAGERVPYEAALLDEDRTVRILPLRPLRKAARHALVVTTEATDAAGGCLAPAETTRALLFGEPDDPIVAEAAPRYRAALDDLGLDAGRVSALAVFTTADDGEEVAQVAAQEASVPVSWTSPPDCIERDRGVQECTLTLDLRDRRNALGLMDASTEPLVQQVPITVWLPPSDGPLPVVLYGHGLGSRRSEGWRIIRELDELNFALVAMEAVSHGDHPSNADGSSQVDDAMDFLGISLTPPSVNPRQLRGNFDQTVLDRLRLLRLLREQPDLDGDGVDELDPAVLGYLGISLGAILGPELVVLDGDIDGAVLTVGGARLLSIATESTALGDYADLLFALVGSQERFDRLAVAAQHMIDPVDPGTWAPHLLHDRLDNTPAPHVLVQIGMHDDVVPPVTGNTLARAVGAPHLEPIVEEVPLLETIAEGPVVANGPDGATAAFFQFDQVTRGGSVGPAYHVATPESEEGQLQLETFLQTYLREGTPVVIDPYAAMAEE